MSERSVRVLELVARAAAHRGGAVDIRDVCAAAVAALPVDGAGVSTMVTPALRHVLHFTDRISGELEELQLTLGEGPCADAVRWGVPVLSGDLSAADLHERWPAFAPAAQAAGAGALFALPLAGGSGGVLDLYSARNGRLEADTLADALAFAATAGTLLLSPAAGISVQGSGAMEEVLGFDQYRAEIDQAVGMISEQMGVSIDEAAVRLRAQAYTHGRNLADVSVEVVARRLRFDPDGTPRVRT
ncbi:ANTAR domain-containing protein [Streptomyces sp. NPDC047070]|uniref:ANTAR domain-containing protein n=1 Tax=Streptomyces sp. NPDC047070 TaxID=3154923 RepID=UPI0034562B13